MVIQTIEVQPLKCAHIFNVCLPSKLFQILKDHVGVDAITKHLLITHFDIPFLLQKTSCTLQVAHLFLELHDLHNEHC
jgi:hypothetical protein